MSSARLYSGTSASGTEIAVLRVQTQSRLTLVSPPVAKQAGPWAATPPIQDGVVTLRIVGAGFVSSAWIGTLYGRQYSISADDYFLEHTDGDSHQGRFFVEAVDELESAQGRRQFSITLRSAATITYTP